MFRRVWAFHQISALRVELRILRTEVVVDGGALKDALLHAFALAQLKVPHLQYDAEALYEEYAAENREQQFLMDDDSSNGDNAANGERPRIAHEYLGRVGVVP